MLRRPKMILFDYGHTLVNEPYGFDSAKGYEELLRYATRNPNHVPAAEIGGFADNLFRKSCISKARALGVEVNELIFYNLLFDYFQIIFEVALRKAKLPADEVWYCGDNTECDVYGASGVGMFPVWYHSPIPCDYRKKELDVRPDCEHLYIRDWAELIGVLEGLR